MKHVWQPSFVDRRVRDSIEYAKFKNYIWQNPVRRGLVRTPEEHPYSSAHPSFRDSLDPVPQRLKPISYQLYRRPKGLLHPVATEFHFATAGKSACATKAW
jgi:hypothetical protein